MFPNVSSERRSPPFPTDGAVVFGAALTLLWLERRRPLRPHCEERWRRDLRNLTVAALGAATLHVVERPVTDWATRLVEARGFGLLPRLRLPRWAAVPLAVALMDYTLYLWHVGLHRVPLLWRLHRAHHADLEVSASTALRLHFSELALSAPWRAAQVLLIGADRRALALWRTLTTLAILFHHANLRLPSALDRRLAWLVVTPRMHGIHHSLVPDEVGSNWSSGLSVWDRLHGTLRLDRPQPELGVPDLRRAGEVGLVQTLLIPFRRAQAG